MIELIKGVVMLVLLILSRLFSAHEAKKVEQDKTIQELKDAIKNGDTSTITATLSGLR